MPHTHSIVWISFILILTGVGILWITSELKRKKILSIFPNFIFGIELGLFKDGRISKLKLTSTCPKKNCGGKLRFYYNIEEDKYFFICNRNRSQHRFEFDFTTLDY